MNAIVRSLLSPPLYRTNTLALPRRIISVSAAWRFRISLSLAGAITLAIGLYVFSVNASILEGQNLIRLGASLKEESRELEKASRELARLSSPKILRSLSQAEAMTEVIRVSYIRTEEPLVALPRP